MYFFKVFVFLFFFIPLNPQKSPNPQKNKSKENPLRTASRKKYSALEQKKGGKPTAWGCWYFNIWPLGVEMGDGRWEELGWGIFWGMVGWRVG